MYIMLLNKKNWKKKNIQASYHIKLLLAYVSTDGRQNINVSVAI